MGFGDGLVSNVIFYKYVDFCESSRIYIKVLFVMIVRGGRDWEFIGGYRLVSRYYEFRVSDRFF